MYAHTISKSKVFSLYNYFLSNQEVSKWKLFVSHESENMFISQGLLRHHSHSISLLTKYTVNCFHLLYPILPSSSQWKRLLYLVRYLFGFRLSSNLYLFGLLSFEIMLNLNFIVLRVPGTESCPYCMIQFLPILYSVFIFADVSTFSIDQRIWGGLF